MQHSFFDKSRFYAILAVFALSMLSVFTNARDAGARSFVITQQKAFNMKVGDWDIVDITNLAGKTQYLTVNVFNSDPSLKMQMLDMNSHIVDLDKSIVLRKDSTGFDHGTLIFSHPTQANASFTAEIVLSDANNQTIDTLLININDGNLPALKHAISISPESPLTIPVTKGTIMAIHLTVTNLTNIDRLVVSVAEPWGSNRFNPEHAFFYLGATPTTKTFDYKINYTIYPGMTQDSALFIFGVDPTYASDTVKIVMIDTTKRNPYITIIGKNFFGALPGSQHCDEIIIENPNGTPVSITDLTITGPGASDFALNPAPSFPLALGEFTKITVPFCYNAPNARNTYSTPEFGVTYHADGVADYTSTIRLYGSTVACLGVTPDTMEFGGIIAGGHADGEVVVTNTFDHSITLTSESWDNAASGNLFSLTSPALPVTLASKESATLKFRLAPPATTFGECYGIYYINFTGGDDSTCTRMQVDLEGQSIDPNDTSRSVYQLFPNIKSAMPIQSDQQTTTKDFIFYNNRANNVKVVSVSVKDGTHFAIVSPTTTDLPITLKPGDQMKVTISFDATTNGYYNDELDIATENGLASQAFSLQGMRTASAGVKSQNMTEPKIMLSPNPSHGPVAIAISDANIKSIDIYDMLGNLVASEMNSNLWVWDGKMTDGSTVSDGTYFIRASGVTTTGAPFVKTTKLLRR